MPVSICIPTPSCWVRLRRTDSNCGSRCRPWAIVLMLSAMRFAASMIAAVDEAHALLVEPAPSARQTGRPACQDRAGSRFSIRMARMAPCKRPSAASRTRLGFSAKALRRSACGVGPDLVEAVGGLRQGRLLVRQDRQALRAHPIDIGKLRVHSAEPRPPAAAARALPPAPGQWRVWA